MTTPTPEQIEAAVSYLREALAYRPEVGEAFDFEGAAHLTTALNAIASLQAENAILREQRDTSTVMAANTVAANLALKAEVERYERDAKRYAWLRDGNAYAPEEESIRGGQELDELCDQALAPEPPAAPKPQECPECFGEKRVYIAGYKVNCPTCKGKGVK